MNTTPSGGTVQILIRQRYTWRLSILSPICSSVNVTWPGLMGATGNLQCFVGSCINFNSTPVDGCCTDYSNALDWSSSERLDVKSVPIGVELVIGFSDFSFVVLAIAGNGIWYLTSRIDVSLRPDGKLNTSPRTQIVPVIRRTINMTHILTIPMFDDDQSDLVRCRWSTNGTLNNTNNFDECASICDPTLPFGYTLFNDNCTLIFTLNSLSYYGITLQIEDYFNSTTTRPMSSIPVQFLLYGISSPIGCSMKPSLFGSRPNQG